MANTTYATVAELKERVGVDASNTANDTLLQQMLNASARVVDQTTRGWIKGYEAFSDSASGITRKFDDEGSGVVEIDDLLVVTTVTRGAQTIDSDHYKLTPSNTTPYTRLLFRSDSKLIAGINNLWYGYPYKGVGLEQIAITGTWGYCTVADRPPEIKEATLTQAERLYERAGMAASEILTALRNPYTKIDPLVVAMLEAHRRPPGV